nr:MAG TPA: hypothetical protein [Caudoviricetes sp.]
MEWHGRALHSIAVAKLGIVLQWKSGAWQRLAWESKGKAENSHNVLWQGIARISKGIA